MSAAAELSIIVAMTPERVIGKDNALPWHLPEDLAHFKQTTMGHPVLMGRKTYEAIGRPLPGRQNIVVTRDRGWTAEGVEVAHGLEEAIGRARHDREIFVIGGAQLYAAALPRATKIYLTTVHARVAGDTLFPPLDEQRWRQVSRSALQYSRSGLPFTLSVFRRR